MSSSNDLLLARLRSLVQSQIQPSDTGNILGAAANTTSASASGRVWNGQQWVLPAAEQPGAAAAAAPASNAQGAAPSSAIIKHGKTHSQLVQLYTSYYHSWLSQSQSARQALAALPPPHPNTPSNNAQREEIERREKWASYYASNSAALAHYHLAVEKSGGVVRQVRPPSPPAPPQIPSSTRNLRELPNLSCAPLGPACSQQPRANDAEESQTRMQQPTSNRPQQQQRPPGNSNTNLRDLPSLSDGPARSQLPRADEVVESQTRMQQPASNRQHHQQQRPPSRQPPRIQPINTGTILSNESHDDHLIGRPAAHLQNGLKTISAFLRQHQFLSTSGNENNDTTTTNFGLARIYSPTIEEFKKSQVERQAAGLRTNTSGASAAAMAKVVECHAEALKHGLDVIGKKDDPFLTNCMEARLCSVHSKLCPDIPQSGRYRANRVRASNTSFTSPENVREEMEKFALAAKRLQTKWTSSSTVVVMDETQWCDKVYKMIGLAAIILFGINDVHPFQDGNGRTSRIFMNIALNKLLGLPFSIIITATIPQRREYVNALKESRSRLQQISTQEQQSISEESRPSQRIRPNPVFESLIEVVIERVLHAVVQVNSLIQSKTQAAAVDEEARIARRVRERSAEGQCVICLDGSPNISTLCCGQVVHMTCLAEWLSNQGSCIGCRKPMPRLNQRVQPQNAPNDAVAVAVAVPNNESNNQNDGTEDTTDDTETTEDTTTESDGAGDNNAAAASAAHAAPAYETTEDTTTEDDTTDDVVIEQNNNAAQDDTTEDTTEDTTTDDDTNAANNDQNDSTEDTTEDSTTDDTPAQQQQPVNQSRTCTGCGSNQYAVDCTNEYCGSCCQLYGQTSCTRHNHW